MKESFVKIPFCFLRFCHRVFLPSVFLLFPPCLPFCFSTFLLFRFYDATAPSRQCPPFLLYVCVCPRKWQNHLLNTLSVLVCIFFGGECKIPTKPTVNSKANLNQFRTIAPCTSNHPQTLGQSQVVCSNFKENVNTSCIKFNRSLNKSLTETNWVFNHG